MFRWKQSRTLATTISKIVPSLASGQPAAFNNQIGEELPVTRELTLTSKSLTLQRVNEASRFNAESPPLRVCENYRRVHLAFGDGPIPLEEPVFLPVTDYLKAVPFI